MIWKHAENILIRAARQGKLRMASGPKTADSRHASPPQVSSRLDEAEIREN